MRPGVVLRCAGGVGVCAVAWADLLSAAWSSALCPLPSALSYMIRAGELMAAFNDAPADQAAGAGGCDTEREMVGCVQVMRVCIA